ncbi:MAG: hypothetical protein ACI91J_000249, partial [Yoonia sp.]
MNFGICRPSDRHLFLIGPTKLFIVCAWCFSVLLLPAAVAPPMPEPVRAVFEARCFKCHGPEKQKGK